MSNVSGRRTLLYEPIILFIRRLCLLFASMFAGRNMLVNFVKAAYIAAACIGIKTSIVIAVIIAIGSSHWFCYYKQVK
jgi:hypothetical protein